MPADDPQPQADGQSRTTQPAQASAGTNDVEHAVALPDPETCRELIRMMLLIRRFEERSAEMYMRAKIGGFLHLAIGEEATIVGTVSAMRPDDCLLSTYRAHGQALARGTPPAAAMAELFGRVDGVCKGRGGSMHMFDAERRFLGGYGIVGCNLPIAAGVALAHDYLSSDEVTVCTFGDGASNQGTFGETMNLAALWRLPIVFVCVNNQFGMGTALSRHSAVTDLSRKAESLGVPGEQVDGMDVTAVRECMTRHLHLAREERQPTMVEAITYRFRGHSVADPQEYRTEEEVDEWRKRDPLTIFGKRLQDAGIMSAEDIEQMDSAVQAEVEQAVVVADESPDPPVESLYDDVYVLGDQVQGWYLVDERGPKPHKGEREHTEGLSDTDLELAEASAAYGGAGEKHERALRRKHANERGSGAEEEASGAEEDTSKAREEPGGTGH